MKSSPKAIRIALHTQQLLPESDQDSESDRHSQRRNDRIQDNVPGLRITIAVETIADAAHVVEAKNIGDINEGRSRQSEKSEVLRSPNIQPLIRWEVC